MKQRSSIWRRITHLQIQIDPTIVLSIHQTLSHYGLTLLIPEGIYHVEDINEFIQREMRKNCYYDKVNDKDNIEISANTNTLKSEMILKNNYEVDFTKLITINSLLGFDSKLYTSRFNESENMVNTLTISSILVNIDIISGSYVNGSTQSTRFFQMSLPGIKLSIILIIFFTFQ